MVYLNGKNGEHDGTDRRLVDVTLVKTHSKTIKVQLPDGNVITRKKSRDLPPEEERE